MLYIESEIDAEKLTLINAAGEVVYSSKLKPGKISLDLNDYTSGLYFVRIDTKDGTITRKVIVK